MNTVESSNANVKNSEHKEANCVEQAPVLPNFSGNKVPLSCDDVNTRIIVSLASEELSSYVPGYN
ncbi:hypothetical protein [uncultured Paraglaciecola sp.]|uniref:hypothetical protein n=1 Tax=uncultured Paraglaciecola sp. TaxID=1765024 RepID=UPI002596BAEC|nr:hypothetical protein [uncultured Paraglaciecola sp.]